MNGADVKKVYASGTAHTITEIDSETGAFDEVDFGTIDPEVELNSPGNYLILSRASLEYDDAEVDGEEIIVKMCKEDKDGTLSDVTGASTKIALGVTGDGDNSTGPLGSYSLPAVFLTVTEEKTKVRLYAGIDADLGDGNVKITEAEIVAMRLF